jgi:hypothetical protein
LALSERTPTLPLSAGAPMPIRGLDWGDRQEG